MFVLIWPDLLVILYPTIKHKLVLGPECYNFDTQWTTVTAGHQMSWCGYFMSSFPLRFDCCRLWMINPLFSDRQPIIVYFTDPELFDCDFFWMQCFNQLSQDLVCTCLVMPEFSTKNVNAFAVSFIPDCILIHFWIMGVVAGAEAEMCGLSYWLARFPTASFMTMGKLYFTAEEPLIWTFLGQ